MTTEPRKTFHIIGQPKPRDPAELFNTPAVKFERGDLVQHMRTGKHYRIMRVWTDNRARRLSIDGVQITARRIKMMDTDNNGYRNWRFDVKTGTVRLATTYLRKVQKA